MLGLPPELMMPPPGPPGMEQVSALLQVLQTMMGLGQTDGGI
jgi:hypothetical protein